uniref:Uncharacterized protein n=1 Tax=Anguilla anguilla TaxID=7936 RepID=A0A0E9WHS6_ANGAN
MFLLMLCILSVLYAFPVPHNSPLPTKKCTKSKTKILFCGFSTFYPFLEMG